MNRHGFQPQVSSSLAITPAQIRALHAVMRGKGLDCDEVKALRGIASLKDLSRAQASDLIKELGGGALPNPPGGKSPARRRGKPGVTRMIAPDMIKQIDRMMAEYFDNDWEKGYAWLKKNFKVDGIHKLATAARAGQVIAVLKEMLERRHKGTKERRHGETAIGSSAPSCLSASVPSCLWNTP